MDQQSRGSKRAWPSNKDNDDNAAAAARTKTRRRRDAAATKSSSSSRTRKNDLSEKTTANIEGGDYGYLSSDDEAHPNATASGKNKVLVARKEQRMGVRSFTRTNADNKHGSNEGNGAMTALPNPAGWTQLVSRQGGATTSVRPSSDECDISLTAEPTTNKKTNNPYAQKTPARNANDGELQPAQIKTWNPFMGNTTGEELEMDETAYKMHHALTPEWPSLTLDIVPDAHLGENRTRFPHTVTMVVGTQADKRSKNKLSVLRMSDLCRIPGSGREKTEKELDDEMLGDAWKHEDDDSDSSSSDEEDEEEELDPVLENYSFSHSGGGINRIRVCPHNSSVVGVWGENGEVSLYDIGGAIDLLDRSSLSSNARKNDGSLAIKKEVRKMRKDPFFVYSGHSTEGYAIDWSRVTPGRLATADCDGNIHIWNATHPVTPNDIVAKYGNKSQSSPWSNSSFQVEPMYAAHGDNLDHPSVEDLQWSPTEATVLASAECGGYVRIYDIRCPGKAMISNKIHSGGADVNVISWNKLVGNLLATGGDDGKYCSTSAIVLSNV